MAPALFEVQQQREQLDGLAKAHIVGQARAQAIARQERQPVEAALLVGTELRAQAIGQRDISDGLAAAHAAQQVADPLIGAQFLDGDGAVVGLAGHREAQRLTQRHLARVVRGQRAQRGRDILAAQLDPLAAQAHQRLFQRGELFQLLRRKLLAAKRDLPVETDDGVETQQPQARPLRALDLQPQGRLDGRAFPPCWRENANADLLQCGDRLAEELIRFGAGQVAAVGMFAGETGGDGREGARRLAKPGKRVLPRALESPFEEMRHLTALIPDSGERQQQAGVVARLEEIVQPPPSLERFDERGCALCCGGLAIRPGLE